MTDETAGVPQPDELLRVWCEPGSTDRDVVVFAAGEIDLVSASKLCAVLDELDARPAPPAVVVVDLTKVTFLGSVGLSLLVEQDRRCRDAGGDLRVVTGNRLVARAIAMTGLSETLTLFDTLDDAVAVAS
jgi:anti-sigma B factor antagonist